MVLRAVLQAQTAYFVFVEAEVVSDLVAHRAGDLSA
jgi:hypothetical protein